MKTARCAAVSIAALCLVNAGRADVILQLNSDSLITYLASATPVQGVQPFPSQRGTGIDGSLRARGSYGWAMAANPFGDAVPSMARLGDQNLFTGTYSPTAVDLALPAPGGVGVVIGRSFNGRQQNSGSGLNSNGYMGYDWFANWQPEIVFYADGGDDAKDMIYLVYGADRYLEFKRHASGSDYFRGVNGGAGIVKYLANNGGGGSEPDTYIYFDQAGNETRFFGFDGDAGTAAGQFWKFTDPAGNMVYAGHATTGSTAISSGYSSGKITKMYDAAGRRYCMSFTTVGGVSRVTQVLVETDAGGGWGNCGDETEVARVVYDYYTADGDDHGMAGDLKLVTVTLPQTDGSGVVDVKLRTYYRYYDDVYDNSDGRRGQPHMIKMVVGAEGCRKFDYDADATLEYGGGSDPEFLTDTDAHLKPYSAVYLEYENSATQRIVKSFSNGECGCGGGANGVYEFSYGVNGSFSNTSGYDTGWRRNVVVKQPDAIYKTVYCDEALQPLSTVITDGDPAVSYTDMWATEVIRNGSGQVTEVRTPANNNNSYTHSTGSFGTALTGAGLIQVYGRVSGTDMAGFPESVQFKEGTSGTANFISWTQYSQRDLNFTSGVNVTRPVVVTRRSFYGAATAYNTGSTYDDTAMSYAWWSSTNTDVLYITPKSVTTTLPVVTTGQNGSNSANTRAGYLRKDGTTAFAVAEDGITTYSQFTNGQLTKRIEDVITSGSFPSGDDPNTDWGITETGSGSDRTTQYAFDAQGRMSTMTDPDGRIHKNYYSRLKDGRMVTIAWPRYTSAGGGTYFGPASYGVNNHAGKSEFQGMIAITSSGLTDALTTWIDETDADPITALDKGTLARMGTSVYTPSGHQMTESRSYFSLPGSGAGSEGTNYDAVRSGYDVMGRKYRTKDATGTITRLVFDDLGRTKETWLGTNDADEAGTDNIVKVTANTYDGGGDGGNSLVTMVTRFVEDSSTDQRQTSFLYDVRGRAIVTSPPQAPYTVVQLDNLGRMTASGQYSSSSGLAASTDPTSTTSNRVALSTTYYDAMGRVYESRRYEINQSTGAVVQVSTVDQYVPSLSWYDAAGRGIKSVGATVNKTVYDRLGRATHRFTCASLNDSAYSDASGVSGDKVVEESQTTYESTDSDNVVMSATIARESTDTSGTGALDSNGDSNTFKYTAANLSGRIQISATWFDDWDRVIDTVAYGTYGGGDFDRKPSGSWLTTPSRSDTELRTTTVYSDDGTVLSVTDPKALETRWAYDVLGRKLTEIRNYGNGTPSGPTGADDVYTRFVYSQGKLIKQWADLDGDNAVDADDQVTLYIYGSTKGTPSAMKVANGNFLRAVVYPDSSNAGTTVANIDSDSSDVVSFAYNAQGQQTYKKDQAGTVLETVYDDSGRRIHHKATALGSGIDNAVLRVTTSYLSRGLIDKVTQFNTTTVGSPDTSGIVDQVQYTYDDWGNIATFVQDVDSAIGGGGRASFTASYTYEKAGSSTTANTLRCTGMSYPGGSDLTYDYGTLDAGSLNPGLSRVARVKVGVVTAGSYGYRGMGQVVSTGLDEAGVYQIVDSGDLDRFNRVTTCDWYKDLSTDRTFYNVGLTYDRDSNITTIMDAINKNVSGNRNFEAAYSMDGLNRLTATDEGELSSGTIASAKRSRIESWTLTQTGNWSNHKLDLNGGSTPNYSDAGDFQEDGTFNIVNELTKREIDTNNTAGYETTYNAITYDAAGNLTDDKQTYKCVYDAWGRLRIVNNQSSALVAEYTYNGLNYRIGWHYDANASSATDGSDPQYWFCYDTRWRVLATFRGTDSDPKERFVYHNAGLGGSGSSSYIDAVILRQRDANTTWTSSADGVLEERRYYCQNWRSDVSAVLTDNGKMVESVKYSSYGVPFAMPAGDTDSDGDWDATDSANITADVANTDARRDTDLDGNVNSADITQANLAKGTYQTLGRGLLSSTAVTSRKSYAGYESAFEFEGANRHLSHIRNRVYDADLGRWTRRDPIGYVDGMDLYEYCESNALRSADPSGTLARACATDLENTGCATLCAKHGPGGYGVTYCPILMSTPQCCLCTKYIDLDYPKKTSWITDCIDEHEQAHMNENPPCPRPGTGTQQEACRECMAYGAELNCLERKRGDCWIRGCERAIDARIRDVLIRQAEFCGRCSIISDPGHT